MSGMVDGFKTFKICCPSQGPVRKKGQVVFNFKHIVKLTVDLEYPHS